MHQQQYDNLTKLQKSMLPGSLHDYLIRALRIILPLIIVALVTFLILKPLTVNDELSFVLDKNQVDLAPERLRVTDALYRGEDSQGRPFSVKAGSAVQKSSDAPILDMEDFVGRIILNSGPAILTGQRGNYNLDNEIMRVEGPLDYKSEAGYEFTASNVEIRLQDQNIESFGTVNGKTKFGTFSANKLIGDLGDRTIILEGNARLTVNRR